MAWIRGPRPGRGTSTRPASSSLVAATLLDLKAARLLPAAEVEDDEDLALLEARDLLFARLLQYRAFKDVAATLAARMATEARRVPRAGAGRAAVRRAAARAGPRDHARAARRDRRPGDAAAGRRPPSGWSTCTPRRSASASRPCCIVDRLRRTAVRQLPGADRRRRRDARHRGPLPRPARAVPRGRRRVRPGRAARRADDPLDRRGRRATSRWTTSSTSRQTAGCDDVTTSRTTDVTRSGDRTEDRAGRHEPTGDRPRPRAGVDVDDLPRRRPRRDRGGADGRRRAGRRDRPRRGARHCRSERVELLLRRARGRVRRATAAASSCGTWPGAGGSTAAPSTPPSSSGSCSTARRPG